MKVKMKCRIVENNLIEYIEKSLPVDLISEIDAHLGECTTCQALLKEVNTTYNSFGYLSEPSLEPYFITRVEAKMQHHNPAVEIISTRIIFSKIAASILIIIGIGIGVFIGGKVQVKVSTTNTLTKSELLESYASEYNTDDSGIQSLETLITNE